MSHSPSQSRHIELIDHMRGIAILGVIAVHSLQISKLITGNSDVSSGLDFLSYGRYGPEVFFVISGYLLSSKNSDKTFSAKNFAIRRFARIFPLWLVFLSIYILESKLFKKGGIADVLGSSVAVGTIKIEITYLTVALSALTFTLFLSPILWNQIIPGGWSIQAEVWHYILFPFMVKRSLRFILLIASVLNVLTRFLIEESNLKNFKDPIWKSLFEIMTRVGFSSTLSYFILGIAVNKIVKRREEFKLDVIDIFCAILFLWSLNIIKPPFGDNKEGLLAVLFSVGIAISIKKTFFLRGLFNVIARYSYSMYFTHFLILDLFVLISRKPDFKSLTANLPSTVLLLFLATVLASVCLGWISMKVIEEPVGKFARSLTSKN